MKIVNTVLRAIVERVTQLEWPREHGDERFRLYVFDHLGRDGTPADRWIQNWETDDVTDNFSRTELREIYDAVDEHYKCKATEK